MVERCCQRRATVVDTRNSPLFDKTACTCCCRCQCPCQCPRPYYLTVDKHGYFVLKRIFRKIIKEICHQHKREVYSVFDGGNMKYERIDNGKFLKNHKTSLLFTHISSMSDRVSPNSIQKLPKKLNQGTLHGQGSSSGIRINSYSYENNFKNRPIKIVQRQLPESKTFLVSSLRQQVREGDRMLSPNNKSRKELRKTSLQMDQHILGKSIKHKIGPEDSTQGRSAKHRSTLTVERTAKDKNQLSAENSQIKTFSQNDKSAYGQYFGNRKSFDKSGNSKVEDGRYLPRKSKAKIQIEDHVQSNLQNKSLLTHQKGIQRKITETQSIIGHMKGHKMAVGQDTFTKIPRAVRNTSNITYLDSAGHSNELKRLPSAKKAKPNKPHFLQIESPRSILQNKSPGKSTLTQNIIGHMRGHKMDVDQDIQSAVRSTSNMGYLDGRPHSNNQKIGELKGLSSTMKAKPYSNRPVLLRIEGPAQSRRPNIQNKSLLRHQRKIIQPQSTTGHMKGHKIDIDQDSFMKLPSAVHSGPHSKQKKRGEVKGLPFTVKANPNRPPWVKSNLNKLSRIDAVKPCDNLRALMEDKELYGSKNCLPCQPRPPCHPCIKRCHQPSADQSKPCHMPTVQRGSQCKT